MDFNSRRRNEVGFPMETRTIIAPRAPRRLQLITRVFELLGQFRRRRPN